MHVGRMRIVRGLEGIPMEYLFYIGCVPDGLG